MLGNGPIQAVTRDSSMQIALKEIRLGLRPSVTRIPFRYGKACMTDCPQAVLSVVIEQGAKNQRGFSGDCLPPGWFDKSPGKDYDAQLADMRAVIGCSATVFADEFRQPRPFFDGYLASYARVMEWTREQALPELLGSFGISFLERALLDAQARLVEVPFWQALRQDLYGIVPERIHRELAGHRASQWLGAPQNSVAIRHTVGLGDPLTAADLVGQEPVADGFPESLEEYLQQTAIGYLKVKVANQLDRDLERLRTIAALLERERGPDFALTLDGNEQYQSIDQLAELLARIEAAPELQTLWRNVLVIEQPLERSVALDPQRAAGIRAASLGKPVIIDESDGTWDAFPRALDLGYRGVSTKNCKGPIKSICNAGLVWLRNQQGQRSDYVMTAEDLCTVGVVPVQSDLALVAALGLTHVERNGHHYHRGIQYLPGPQRRQALSSHPDLYSEQHGVVALEVSDGRLHLTTLNDTPGCGFAPLPDIDAMDPVALG